MTLLETLQSHKGGLLRIKTELYWYDRARYDNSPGRICLLLNAYEVVDVHADAATDHVTLDEAAASNSAAALLLIDGSPHWVCVAEADVEVLDEAR